jgi:hypothetical protein
MAAQDSLLKGRSPRYPRISLDSAIAYARRLYEEAHKSSVDPDTAARLMGFRGKSGASAVALGAVRQFGLVEGLRGTLKISDLALRILQPTSREEEQEARHEAAFKPEIFDAVLAHFEGELPRSDEPIKAYLIRTAGFSKAGAEDCIASLRKTLDEVGAQESIAPIQTLTSVTESETAANVVATPPVPSASPDSKQELIRIPLTRDCIAELRLVGEVTSGAVERLIQYIELMKGVWAES